MLVLLVLGLLSYTDSQLGVDVGTALAAGLAGLALAAGIGIGIGILKPKPEAEPQYGYGGGHGGGGGGHGGGGSGYGHGRSAQLGFPGFFGRGKRALAAGDLETENQIFETIAEMDSLDCGKRYICELKVSESNLSVEESALLDTVQETVGAGTAKTLYKDAAYYGSFVSSIPSCAARFSSCEVAIDSVRSFVESSKQQSI